MNRDTSTISAPIRNEAVSLIIISVVESYINKKPIPSAMQHIINMMPDELLDWLSKNSGNLSSSGIMIN